MRLGRRPFNWLHLALALSALLPMAAVLAVELAARLLPPPPLQRFTDVSQLVTDSNNRLLRAFLTRDQKWRLPATISDVPQSYIEHLVAYEDRRFWSHRGVDPLALGRAAFQLAMSRRIISGGSTLTMQAARLLAPAPRGIRAKVRQIIAAHQLETRYSKEQILSIYLTLAPFGGNIEGVRAASIIYYGMEPRDLSIAEASLLIGLPQAPEAHRPDLWRARSALIRNRVLARSVVAGALSADVARSLSDLPITARRRPMMVSAPHAAEAVRRRFPDKPVIQTTIDRDLQSAMERLVREATQVESARVSVAAIIVRNADSTVRAYLSGPNFFAESKAGQIDLVTAIRSPGSTLKPFVYGLAFEKLIVHPQTTMVDGPTRFGNYEPKNFSEGYQGEVTVHDALIRSINTTAVAVLARLGPDRLMARLRSAGVVLRLDEIDRHAGLSLVLGGCGISLADLARLYSGLASGGVRELRLTPQDRLTPPVVLLAADATWSVTNILADAMPPDGFSPRRSLSGGRRIAYKTGTSYSFRDAWAVGYDRDHTIAVWVGRPDGAPNPGSFGRGVAAPLMYQFFDLLPAPGLDVAGTAQGDSLLFRRDGLPERLQRFQAMSRDAAQHPLKLAFPPDGSRIVAIDEALTIEMQVRGGRPPYVWYVNHAPLVAEAGTNNPRWRPPEKGQYRLRVIDQNGMSATSDVWVE